MAAPGGERVILTWEEARALYPGTADVAYLDSAAVGLVSTRVRDAVTAVLTEHQQLSSAAAPSWREHAGHVRASVARLVGGRAGQVAFTQNTSTGLATVTNGLDWRDGDNVRGSRRGMVSVRRRDRVVAGAGLVWPTVACAPASGAAICG